MANDDLATQITVYSRSAHAQRYLRSYGLRSAPGTDVGPNSQPFIEAAAHADVCMVLYADAQALSSNANLRGLTGQPLLARAAARGITGKLPAVGAEGFVIIAAAIGGGPIAEGQALLHQPTGLRFQATVAGTYQSGQLCPVEGIDTGFSTNLPIGTVLDWEEPPQGILPSATVADNGEGQGLTGGQPEETDAQLVQRIIDLQANPPTAGNGAEYRQAAKTTETVAVEMVWSYDAIFGPGTIGVCFTIRPPAPGGSRVPGLPQLADVEAQILNSGFPGDDGEVVFSIVQNPIPVYMGVQWTKAAVGWANQFVWPLYVTGAPVRVMSATNATAFVLATAGTATADPQVGTIIGVYNPGTQQFVRKQIASVTVLTPLQKWSVTCVTANNASDASYTPVGDSPGFTGQAVSPWSESLNLLVANMLGYFGGLGPGEVYASFADPGTRQKREPESPDSWPHTLSSRDLSNTPPRAIVGDAVMYSPAAAGTSYETPIGVPGAYAYLTTLGDFAVFPK